MTLLWADFPSGSHGLYGDSEDAMLDGTPWTRLYGNLVEDPDPSVGAAGKVYEATSFPSSWGGALSQLALAVVSAGAGASFRFWMPSSWTEDTSVAILTDVTGNKGYAVLVKPNGALDIVRTTSNRDSTVLATTTNPVITTNAWWHVSLKADVVTGDVSVQLNGATILSATDAAPHGGTLALASIGRVPLTGGGSPVSYFKDLMIWNTEGAQNNDHPGNVGVFPSFVNGDITLGGWVPSSGTEGYPLIGNAGPPNDASYLSADDTPPAFMEYDLEDLPEDITSIRGIISVVRAAKIDGGDGNLQVSLSPDGVAYADGVNRPITSAFTYWSDVNELNPATGVPWLPSEFNTGARLKINRTL